MFVSASVKTTRSIFLFGSTGLNTTWRNVRSVARRQPRDSVKTLKGSVKTEYDSKFDDDYVQMQDVKDLKNVVRQMFVDTDETQTEAEYDLEEDYGAPIEHAEKFHDMNIREEKQHKSMVKKSIIKKKYFKEPRETNLLTHAAKMQIRHLHNLDPVEWTPEKLAESFPVSVNGVKKLLKNNFELKGEEKIRQHDTYVASQWKLLESGNTKSISPVTQQLYMEGKITRDHRAGNFNLPSPVPEKKIAEVKRKKIGEHAAMIKYYVELKKSTDAKETSLEAKDVGADLKPDNKDIKSACEQRDIQKSVLPEFKSLYPTRREMESMKSASYLATDKPDPDEIEIPQAQFEENLIQEFSEKGTKSSVDVAYEEWLQKQVLEKSECAEKKPQPFDPKDFFEAVKKSNDHAIELRTEKNTAYLYDEHLGYQHPSGKEIIRRHIKIPKEKYVEGALYRIGKNFYADDGEFLYKVFV